MLQGCRKVVYRLRRASRLQDLLEVVRSEALMRLWLTLPDQDVGQCLLLVGPVHW